MIATSARPRAAHSTQIVPELEDDVVVVGGDELAEAAVTVTGEAVADTVAPLESVTVTPTVNGDPVVEDGRQLSIEESIELHPVGSPDQTYELSPEPPGAIAVNATVSLTWTVDDDVAIVALANVGETTRSSAPEAVLAPLESWTRTATAYTPAPAGTHVSETASELKHAPGSPVQR